MISLLTIRPTGMPVQAATVWATAAESTHGNISGVSPCTARNSLSAVASSRFHWAISFSVAGGVGIVAAELRTEVVSAVADAAHEFPFLLPLFVESNQAFLGVGEPLFGVGDRLAVVRAGLLFPFQDLDRNLQLVDPPLGVFDSGRRRTLAEPDPGAGGIQEADRLVGELPAADVAFGKFDRVGHRLVHDSHLVVQFERRDQASHHFDRGFLVRLVDLDRLEAAGEGGVLLEILFILRPRGRSDRAELTTGEGRFEQVRGVALAGLTAGADHRVGLVDEQNDRLG